MKFKSKYKKICLLFVVILISGLILNTVFAQITTASGGVDTYDPDSSSWMLKFLNGVVSKIEGVISSGIFATLGSLINILFVVMYLAYLTIFNLTGMAADAELVTPFPDNIVFNRIPIFDPNFIEPATNSFINRMGIGIFRNLFGSFRTVATTVFIIAAMITGLRLALSSIASKKAQYKEAAMKWVVGFLILIFLKPIMAGIFYANELLVAKLYGISSETIIPIYVTEAIPIFGKAITDILNKVATLFGGDEYTFAMEGKGLGGIVLANMMKSIGGDIVASIVGFVVLGQSTTIAISYFKRGFMCLILGMVSPLIVAADTIVAVQGKQSKLFKNWLKNFSITVFMQSFHAMYMVVLLDIIGNLYVSIYNHETKLWEHGTQTLSASMIGIIVIFLITGLVKLEKMLKGLFGIGDSFAGDLKDGAKGMVKAMGAMKGIGAAAKSLGDNVPKAQQATKRKQAYTAELARVKSQPYREKAAAAFDAAKKAKADGNMDEYAKQRKIAADAMKEAKAAGYNFDPKKGFGTDINKASNLESQVNINQKKSQEAYEAAKKAKADGNMTEYYAQRREAARYSREAKQAVDNTPKNVQAPNNFDYVQYAVNTQGVPSGTVPMTREQQIQDLEAKIAQETSNYKSAKLASIMGPANLAAGIGLGLGMGDDISESLFKGGYITAGLDKATEMIGKKSADKDRKTFNEHEQKQGERYRIYAIEGNH